MINKIFDSLISAIFCLDKDLNILQINQAAESLFDVSGSRSKGQKITNLLLDADDLESVLKESLDSGQPYTRRQSQLVLLSSQTLMVDYAVSSFKDQTGTRLVLEFQPISRYLRIDRDELLRGHQEATRQMIRGMAHEIKNPLGGIRGSAQLLERVLPDEKLIEYTNIIIEEADRLTRLVDRMLGPNSMPHPSMSNIHELLEKIARLLETESLISLTVNRDYDPSIPEFSFDKELMMQALLNIGRNALQALSDTEEPFITLNTRIERQFTIGKTRHRLVVKIEIEDNGPGIPTTIKEKLFFPMISGRPQGTGLGLSLAQSIIHQHGGTIEYKSRPGATVFSIFVPVTDSSSLDCQQQKEEQRK